MPRLTEKPIIISKKQFQAYERVRESGVTNMYAIDVVEELSGLNRKQIITIMETYGDLCEKYPGVRKGR